MGCPWCRPPVGRAFLYLSLSIYPHAHAHAHAHAHVHAHAYYSLLTTYDLRLTSKGGRVTARPPTTADVTAATVAGTESVIHTLTKHVSG